MDTDALLIELIEALQRQTAVIADQAEAIGRLADVIAATDGLRERDSGR